MKFLSGEQPRPSCNFVSFTKNLSKNEATDKPELMLCKMFYVFKYVLQIITFWETGIEVKIQK